MQPFTISALSALLPWMRQDKGNPKRDLPFCRTGIRRRLWDIGYDVKKFHYCKVLSLRRLERKIIRTYDRARLSPDKRTERIHDLLGFRRMRLCESFSYTPENVKAIEEANQRLSDAVREGAAALRRILSEEPKDSTMDYILTVGVQEFRNDGLGSEGTTIYDVLTDQCSQYDLLNKALWICCGSKEEPPTDEFCLYFRSPGDPKPLCWNHVLDRRFVGDIDICHPFYHLYTECDFALQDIINVGKFSYKIEIEPK